MNSTNHSAEGSETFMEPMRSLPAIIVALSTVLLCFAWPKISYRLQLSRLPAMGALGGEEDRLAFARLGQSIYQQGYVKFKESAYRMIGLDGETIVIGPKYLVEMDALGDAVLSLPAANHESQYSDYTLFAADEPIVNNSLKQDLTPALPKLNPIIWSEAVTALKEDMPDCNEWTDVNVFMVMISVFAKIAGRIFVGPDIYRHPDYLHSATTYSSALYQATLDIKRIRPILRPLLAPRLDSVRDIMKMEKLAEKCLDPIVQTRRAAAKDPNWVAPSDVLQFCMQAQNAGGPPPTSKLVKWQTALIFASVQTVVVVALDVIYHLSVNQQYLAPLREEIHRVMASNGGEITTQGLKDLVKLDSYMREVARVYPVLFTSFKRKAVRGFTLSNGQYIPKGSIIEVPSDAVHLDPEIVPNASEFDGFRWAKLRESSTNAADRSRSGYVAVNAKNMFFGYGRRACPGRFFAANEIKMVLAKFFVDYDFKNSDGSTKMYARLDNGRQSSPDPTKTLSVRKVQA